MKNHKRTTALLSVLVAVTMCMAAFTPSMALFGKSEAQPAVSAFAKSDTQGALITFSEEDFTSRVSGSEKLDAIVISALPENGALRLAGRTLERGEAIGVASLNTLCYVPEDEAGEVFTTFSFLPVFSKSGASGEEVRVSINLSAQPNSAPIAQDVEYETYVNVRLCAPLKATDADGDPVSFQITSQPSRGTVEIKGQGFAYTPAEGKTGKDSFTYTATDERGNVSKPATVSITINKRPAKETFQYDDMQDSRAHYAALRLRDEGILIGETIGESNFLYPDKTVSRAEFVALVASVTELSLPTASVGTGLSDNSEIPTWAQPYVAAAIHTGIVIGEATETGNRVFRAQDGITRAEAASIINRALSLAADGRGLQFSDSAEVPQWAAQSVINTTFAQIVPVFGDNTVRASSSVTREDAAQMLYQMLCYQEAQTSTGGLLGLFK